VGRWKLCPKAMSSQGNRHVVLRSSHATPLSLWILVELSVEQPRPQDDTTNRSCLIGPLQGALPAWIAILDPRVAYRYISRPLPLHQHSVCWASQRPCRPDRPTSGQAHRACLEISAEKRENQAICGQHLPTTSDVDTNSSHLNPAKETSELTLQFETKHYQPLPKLL
jgi:hypothetical protein